MLKKQSASNFITFPFKNNILVFIYDKCRKYLVNLQKLCYVHCAVLTYLQLWVQILNNFHFRKKIGFNKSICDTRVKDQVTINKDQVWDRKFLFKGINLIIFKTRSSNVYSAIAESTVSVHTSIGSE